jgi:hypothetical protein
MAKRIKDLESILQLHESMRAAKAAGAIRPGSLTDLLKAAVFWDGHSQSEQQ